MIPYCRLCLGFAFGSILLSLHVDEIDQPGLISFDPPVLLGQRYPVGKDLLLRSCLALQREDISTFTKGYLLVHWQLLILLLTQLQHL